MYQSWNFYQILGHRPPDDELKDEDIITTIQFEKHGNYLAIGDQGGRVVIFERDDRSIEPLYRRKLLEELDSDPGQRPKFRLKSEFHSHEAEIHRFSNVEVKERIKKVSWCVAQNGLLLILSANNKTIKLWTIKERKKEKIHPAVRHGPHRFFSSENVLMSRSFTSGQDSLSSDNGYHLEWTENLSREDPPSQDIDVDDDEIEGTENTFYTKCQKLYTQDRSLNINSISNNSDAETFISADQFRINLWNLEFSDRNFNIIDMTPSKMDNTFEMITTAEFHPVHCNLLAYGTSIGVIRMSDLTQAARCDRNYLTDLRQAARCDQMITTAEFHPVHCNLLAYGTSIGVIRISDLRQAARCDPNAALFLDQSLLHMKSPFEEVAACISDVKFLAHGLGGQQLISRDYMHMKLWDMRMASCPVVTFAIHEHLRPRLAMLYSTDHIFDKFDCCFGGDGLSLATGSYGNRLKIYSIGNRRVEDIKLDIIGNLDSCRMPVLPKGTVRRWPTISSMNGWFDEGGGIDDDFDYNINSKRLRVAWHPTSNLVAGATQSSLILYHV